ncbi:hypothetical protein [Paramagnetospirillum magneticum]|nr:hypothetical protein [Paramagnetospirillum magneticum]
MPINIFHYAFNEYAPIFEEVIDAMRSSFCRLGVPHRYSVNTYDHHAYNILVGHVAFMKKGAFPPHLLAKTAVFQLESLTAGGILEMNPDYLEILRRAHMVWDYSPTNVAVLKSLGLSNVVHVPVGHDPVLERIPDLPRKEIDVLFYGNMTERRQILLDALSGAGLKVERRMGLFGPNRDNHIANAKAVINIHQLEGQVMEQVRLSYLLTNHRFVISEESSDAPYDGGIVTAPYDQLVEACLRHLRPYDKSECDRIADRGQSIIREIPFWRGVRDALLASGHFPFLELESLAKAP